MIICPWCNSKQWKLVNRSVNLPSWDKYRCKQCGKLFYRYENTRYEKEYDPKHERKEKL
jgi:transposase-like protein